MGNRRIDFMLIGLPRSGTTWAANLFCTEKTHCFHDPLYTVGYPEWDAVLRHRAPAGVKVGVACTGVWNWPAWVNEHPANKVIIHRGADECAESMATLGAPEIDYATGERLLTQIKGLHVPYTDLFDPDFVQILWRHAVGRDVALSPQRHKELCAMHITPRFEALEVDMNVARKLVTNAP